MTKIRTRFAVSPTGFMHLGGVRTAYFSWLASQPDGIFILRVEDTDKKREVEGAVEAIKESLQWLGIKVNEGPDEGGEFGPYTQSERLDVYKKFATELYEKGLAYADPYTPEEVQEFRKQANEQKIPFLYRNHRPENPPEWDGSQPLRFKQTEIKSHKWHDVVRGDLSAGEEVLDDIVIMKSDGYPTYNFAHIVDDHLMEITHVLRGEEFISSMPNYLAIYEAFGWEQPVYVTLPPVLNKNGGKKLSKRDGAESVLWYRDNGYLKEAVLNFLATLGWNDGTEKEIWSPEEIAQAFEIERVQKSGAKFDDERLNYLNGVHIRSLDLDKFVELAKPYLPDSAKSSNSDKIKTILSLVHERVKFLSEIPELVDFFFERPQPALDLVTKDFETEEAKVILGDVANALSEHEFDEPGLEQTMRDLSNKNDLHTGKFFRLLRTTVTGREVAPGLFETMSALGKEETLERINGTATAL